MKNFKQKTICSNYEKNDSEIHFLKQSTLLTTTLEVEKKLGTE